MRLPCTVAALAVLMLVAPSALADVPPPDAEGCFGLVAGDACKTDEGQEGGCVKQTCSRITETGTEEYECLICEEGAQPNKGGCAISPGAGVRALGLAGVAAALLSLGGLVRARRRDASRASAGAMRRR